MCNEVLIFINYPYGVEPQHSCINCINAYSRILSAQQNHAIVSNTCAIRYKSELEKNIKMEHHLVVASLPEYVLLVNQKIHLFNGNEFEAIVGPHDYNSHSICLFFII